LKHMGFGQKWWDIIALLLAFSSRVLLNGCPGRTFFHRCGLSQGDSLPPMLFILAMEPLQGLLEKATIQHVITPLRLRAARMRASFYAMMQHCFSIQARLTLLLFTESCCCLEMHLAWEQVFKSVWPIPLLVPTWNWMISSGFWGNQNPVTL
jgi:hypothetical protein